MQQNNVHCELMIVSLASQVIVVFEFSSFSVKSSRFFWEIVESIFQDLQLDIDYLNSVLLGIQLFI